MLRNRSPFLHSILRTRTAFALVLIAGLLACEGGALFLPDANGEQSVEIRMVDSGSTVQRSDGLSISFETLRSQSDTSDFDSVVLVLEPASEISGLTSSGLSERRERRVNRDELGADRVLFESLEDLSPGLYTVIITVYNGPEEIQSIRRSVFVVDEIFAVDGLSVYPATMTPGSSGIVQATLQVPDGSDPWLRWSIGDEILASGYATDGYTEIEWQAPSRESVYRIGLEVFPSRPSASGLADLRSSIRESADVLVSSARSARESQLGSIDSFFLLYRLQGSVSDDGFRASIADEPTDHTVIGHPRLSVVQGLFGYTLDGSSGFQSEGAGVPFIGATPTPFTLHARIVPEPSSAGSAGNDSRPSGTLFETETSAPSFRFAVSVDADGTPAVRLSNGDHDDLASGPPGLLPGGEAALLSVSVVPAERSTAILWFLNGRLVDISELAVAFPASPVTAEHAGGSARIDVEESEITARQGVTRIGAAERGFRGLVDEIGILFRDGEGQIGTDSAVFRNAMESRYAGRLAYARGFQGMFVPDELQTIGRVTVRRGALELDPGASVLFPAFLFEHEQLVVELGLGVTAPEAEGTFRFEIEQSDGTGTDDRSQLIDVSSSGSATQDGERIGTLTFVDDPPVLVLRLSHQDGVVHIRGAGDFETSIDLGDARFTGVRLSALHNEARVIPFRIRSVVAHRDRVSLADRLSAGAQSEGD
ncbi:MAG: hypothetical protein EA383_17610 [Spirochaetaceae bacterium]|nr:MAG: hypothetical protein EA383_17610 [Spirochaetaceae bacterium]